MEEAKAMLAKHALEQEIAGLRRKQPKQQSAEYLQSAPRLLEALEGGAGVRGGRGVHIQTHTHTHTTHHPLFPSPLSLSLSLSIHIRIHIHIASQGLFCGAAC